ncbi:acyltransferase domain-containing protein [Nocardia sp. NPDC051750]|uniref:acyltransferase domain-containing protein n=1 Tax=Nocardia sp. NPDC051750 TaxID=3364325 RepID=UPI0037B90E47
MLDSRLDEQPVGFAHRSPRPRPDPTVPATTPMTGSPRGVVFLFSPEGGEHDRMGRILAGRYPTFAATVIETNDAVVAAGGPQVWTPRYGFRHPGSTAWPDRHHRDPQFTQPALFTYQVAIAALLISWGVRPDAVIGHGIGELAAAVTAGALPAADAARVAVARGRVSSRSGTSDVVAELTASVPEVLRLVAPVREKVAVAAVHGPDSVLIAGAPRYIDTVVRRAGRRGITAARSTLFPPAHAHRGAAAGLRADLGELRPGVPDIAMYSTTHRGALIGSAVATADYWADNFIGTVELDAALSRAAQADNTIVLEVGPDPVLGGTVRRRPEFAHSTYPAACRDDEGTAFLTCLAQVQATRATTMIGAYREASRTSPGAAPAQEPHPREDGNSSPAEASADKWSATGAKQPGNQESSGPESSDIESVGEHTAQVSRAEVAGAGTLASIRLADDLPPTDIIAWTRMVDANRAIRFLTGRVALDPPMRIDPAGTYVVSGGLGALGSVMVRRLLVAGARDVLVPTRSPRPVPPLLEGFEDRVVVVRCDTADRPDLDNALRDIRESGCTIRGVVHAAQVFEDTVIAAVTTAGTAVLLGEPGGRASHDGSPDPALDAGRLARRFARISPATANLIELTAADPVTFFAVFSTPFRSHGTSGEVNPVISPRRMDPG